MLDRIVRCQYHHADARPAADHLCGGEGYVLNQMKISAVLRVNRVHKSVLQYRGLVFGQR